MRRPFFFILFIMALASGFLLNYGGRYRDVFRGICDLTEDHYFRSDERLKDWLRICRSEASRVPLFTSKRDLLESIQDVMDLMGISHFQIYDAAEDRKLWKGEAIDTGMRTRFVEDRLLVYRVLPGSSAAEAGVRPGDEIVRIQGADHVTPWGAQHRSGFYVFRAGGRLVTKRLDARMLLIDSSPKVTRLSATSGVLELPSFRSEFFTSRNWMKTVARFTDFSDLIVDIRENAGGNFVAMLRALSTFDCQPKTVGSLVQPRSEINRSEFLEDNMEDNRQIEELANFSHLWLRTFSGYGCYTGRITALIGPSTSSVAEIFAYGLSRRPRTRIWGGLTAGDVVLAVWYDLPDLGKGYSVSIPEAVFLTPDNSELEGNGVHPTRFLEYDLKRSLQGQDSWIEDARR